MATKSRKRIKRRLSKQKAGTGKIGRIMSLVKSPTYEMVDYGDGKGSPQLIKYDKKSGRFPPNMRQSKKKGRKAVGPKLKNAAATVRKQSRRSQTASPRTLRTKQKSPGRANRLPHAYRIPNRPPLKKATLRRIQTLLKDAGHTLDQRSAYDADSSDGSDSERDEDRKIVGPGPALYI